MKKLLVITDLDASFIDENYSYAEAVDAINALREREFPLIFNSSKTLIECSALAEELQLDTPRVAENGGIIAAPRRFTLPPLDQEWKTEGELKTFITGLSRDFILSEAHALRTEHNYKFLGFADWTAEELTEKTRLSLDAATMAKQRHVSEPIIWSDTEERWEEFKAVLHTKDIRTLRGGKFIHLMGSSDKADGLRIIKRIYEAIEPETEWISVALGDSANDKSMLESADIGILIPHADGPYIEPSGEHIIHAKAPASKGWNDSILELLSTLAL